jgi:hypothetical protein
MIGRGLRNRRREQGHRQKGGGADALGQAVGHDSVLLSAANRTVLDRICPVGRRILTLYRSG